jgi:hypothetical protein
VRVTKSTQTFLGDFELEDRDFRIAAAEALADLRGRPISDAAMARLLAREEVRASCLGSGLVRP